LAIGEPVFTNIKRKFGGGDENDDDAVGFHGPYDLVQFSTARSLKDPLVLWNANGRSKKNESNPG
jgi:hypothetical protein